MERLKTNGNDPRKNDGHENIPNQIRAPCVEPAQRQF